jgi:iron-sulfur cluster repair protein YtfE (RIC family)
MSTEFKSEITIGEIVANDFRAASIFSEEGIDFCCGGNKGFTEACREKGADISQLIQHLEDDLHIHVHLENNILYPKALKLAE